MKYVYIYNININKRCKNMNLEYSIDSWLLAASHIQESIKVLISKQFISVEEEKCEYYHICILISLPKLWTKNKL